MAATMTSVVSNTVCRGTLQRSANGRARVQAVAFQRPSPGYGRRARCAPKGACAPMGGFSFGAGPSGFAGRPVTPQDIANMARVCAAVLLVIVAGHVAVSFKFVPAVKTLCVPSDAATRAPVFDVRAPARFV